MIFVFHFLLFEGVAVAITPALFEFNHRTNQMNQTLHLRQPSGSSGSSGDKKKILCKFASSVVKKETTNNTNITNIRAIRVIRC